MIDISVDGPPNLGAAERSLRGLESDVDRETDRRLLKVAKELEAAARRETRRLPRGLAAVVARARVNARRERAGVSIMAEGMPQLARIDLGSVDHPVWGNRDVWVTQTVAPGWFSDPMEDGKPKAEQAIEDALEAVAAEIAARV